MAEKNQSGLYEEKIDGVLYEFQKWGAEESTDTLLDITSIIGKPLGMGIAGMLKDKGEEGKSPLDSKVDPEVVQHIMEALSERVGANKKTIKDLIKKLSSDKVLCDGQVIKFNTHYEDRLDHMFRVVKENLEVQYGGFFGGLLGRGAPALRGLMNRGQQTSTGPSGAP